MAFGLVGAGVGALGFIVSSVQRNIHRKRSLRLQRDALDFQKYQYDQWKNIYGSIEENLSNYYNRLSPTELANRGLVAQQKHFQESQKNIQGLLARQGLSGSSFESYLLAQGEYKNVLDKARIEDTAEDEVAKKQLKFLESGRSRRAGIESRIHNQQNRLAQSEYVYGNQLSDHITTGIKDVFKDLSDGIREYQGHRQTKAIQQENIGINKSQGAISNSGLRNKINNYNKGSL